MNRIEYIRYSHRRANSRVRAWIGSVRMRLVRRSRLLGWIWMVPASIFYALVVLFSWLTFCVVLFRDPRFTLHYLESEIECRGLSGAEARRYLDEQHRDYERRLAYGNFTRDEQRRIDQTFAYLYNRYPAPVRDDLNARLDEVQSPLRRLPASRGSGRRSWSRPGSVKPPCRHRPRNAVPSTAAARDLTPRRRTSRRVLPTASSTC